MPDRALPTQNLPRCHRAPTTLALVARLSSPGQSAEGRERLALSSRRPRRICDPGGRTLDVSSQNSVGSTAFFPCLRRRRLPLPLQGVSAGGRRSWTCLCVVVLHPSRRTGGRPRPSPVSARQRGRGYLVDPASSHMLVSKIKPCMSKYEPPYKAKLRMAH